MIEISAGIRPISAITFTPQAHEAHAFRDVMGTLNLLANAGPCWTVEKDRRTVALGGYTVPWPGRAVLWGFLGENCRAAMPAMTRRMRAEIAALDVDRVEAHVAMDYAPGHRWLAMLGDFQYEGLMRKFANGADYALYARTR